MWFIIRNDELIYDGKYYSKCPIGTSISLNETSLNIFVDGKENMINIGDYCL